MNPYLLKLTYKEYKALDLIMCAMSPHTAPWLVRLECNKKGIIVASRFWPQDKAHLLGARGYYGNWGWNTPDVAYETWQDIVEKRMKRYFISRF